MTKHLTVDIYASDGPTAVRVLQRVTEMIQAHAHVDAVPDRIEFSDGILTLDGETVGSWTDLA